MSNKEREPKLNQIIVSTEGMDELFEENEVVAKYQSIRSSEQVEKHYLEMLDGVIKSCKDVLFREFLQDTKTKKHYEVVIKASLLKKAIEKLIQEGNVEIHNAIMSVITEESLNREIDTLQRVLEMTIKDLEKTKEMTEVLNFCFD